MSDVALARGVISSLREDSVLLLAPDDANIITLTGSGYRAWQAIVETNDLDSALTRLSTEFDRPVGDLRRDITPFVSELVCLGVLAPRHGDDG